MNEFDRFCSSYAVATFGEVMDENKSESFFEEDPFEAIIK